MIGRWSIRIGLVASLLLLLAAASSGAARLLIEPARQAMDEWQCAGTMVGSEASWEPLLGLASLAHKLDPLSADIALDLGRLYEWKALTQPVWHKSAQLARDEAIVYYREALALRPVWGLGWANLAQTKVLNRELDEEAFGAIEKAMRFGHWEIEVQRRVVWLTIGIWEYLPQQVQAATRQQLRDILAKDHGIQYLVAVALRYDWLDELARLVKNPEQLAYLERIREQAERYKVAFLQQSFRSPGCR